ncbi:DUF456 domain-containing protein [Flavobacteriaceae bacterium]|jgi:uncharacterized protein YqgC (DUF456 family)|nr:DUF456 domain-containing protein [Flavobacteriaceae bacterium]MDC6461989.1 DUF456 domain-containing protein [Flavobacteriaceae bacterium]
MDIILLIIGLLLCLIGIVGSFLPIIPGPVTSWLGILLLNLTSVVDFNLNFVLITLTVAISVGILDYLIPVLGVKKLGGTRSGQIGTTLGLIIALIILGPIGIIIGPFGGALLGEMSTKKSFQDSIKPAFGAFVGVVAGSVIKFLISLSFLFFYFDIFWGYRESFF